MRPSSPISALMVNLRVFLFATSETRGRDTRNRPRGNKTLNIEGKPPGYNNCYHFHAAPKYRQHVLVGSIAGRLDQLLREKSMELGWKIHAIAIDSDHAHFLIESTASPSEIAQRLFGYASVMLRKEFPGLKEINAEHFWGGRACKEFF